MTIPIESWAGMTARALPGDAIFFWNRKPISYAIEEITEIDANGKEQPGPSHVIQLARFSESLQWFEFESVFLFGCRMLPLSHYATSASRMLLARRQGATVEDVRAATGAALDALGRPYELKEEVEIALHRILPFAPVNATANALYCSGYLANNWRRTAVPYGPARFGGNPTPMDCLMDARTGPVCWVN